ncbi:hypothetical protein DFQ27_006892 [Actinomortierella ambigua]|uniref:Uncharacterized protein n=1 Tax=Actinomortierella ambigua TaxID=1343610 RepID=A0A9P6PUI1_9FUNG|nr:hypothetical protein DFQ27_006892 [Actinomortierella ambigua]
MSEKHEIDVQDGTEKRDVNQYDLLTEHEKELLELEARLNAELDAKLLANPNKHPTAIYFILPNEFGERFCYYGVQPNLNKYFRDITGMDPTAAKVYSTTFTMLAYFFPLIGAAVSDSFLGKWWTIISFSIVYLIGMILLTVFAVPGLLGPVGTVSRGLTFLPMIIIALGTGGIKPCVSSHGGDQYLPSQELAKDRFFSLFYVSINVGGLLTQFIVPLIADKPCLGLETCYTYGFLLPTIVFFLALVVFAIGHRWYRIVPPLGEFLPWKAVKAATLAMGRYRKASPAEREAKGHWLNFAEAEYGAVFVDEVRDFGLVLVPIVFPMSFCWMLYNQNSNEWANQYYLMNGALFGRNSKVLQVQFSIINTILIIILVPILAYVVYPFCERRGWNFTLTRRMGVGYFLVILSFALSAGINKSVENAYLSAGRKMEDATKNDGMYCEECISGWAQFPQWFILTLGECMFSPTGVQFMYVEAGRQFRAVSTSFWLVAVSFGSVWITIFDPAMVEAGIDSTTRNWIYSGVGLGGLVLYCIAAYYYTPRKARISINEPSRLAKEAEYALMKQ